MTARGVIADFKSWKRGFLWGWFSSAVGAGVLVVFMTSGGFCK